MPKCPNCFYTLVLLEHRRKYKCAKCSSLFQQREIEDKEFREWNKKRRLEAKLELEKELEEISKQKNITLTQEEVWEKERIFPRINA
jgi:DNA-directed RNA polymerase subunit RPC12/RpoP